MWNRKAPSEMFKIFRHRQKNVKIFLCHFVGIHPAQNVEMAQLNKLSIYHFATKIVEIMNFDSEHY